MFNKTLWASSFTHTQRSSFTFLDLIERDLSVESSECEAKHQNTEYIEKWLEDAGIRSQPVYHSQIRQHTDGATEIRTVVENVRAVVFWASQSGTAEALASRYASELSTTFPLGAMTANLADYDHKHMPDVPSQALLVFILSTFGDGDPPDNGTALLESLHQLRKQSANLNNVRYLIFGLGNSNYTHFNKYALDIDGMLKGMGATRLGRLGLGNDREGATEEDFVAWKNESIQQVARTLHLRPVEREYSPRIQIRPWRGGNCDTRHGASPTVYYGEPQYAPPTADRSTTVVLPIIQAKQLMLSKEAIGESEGSRECVHLEFSLEDHPSITYETGDYLCIWPVNPEQEVSALLKVLGVWNTRKNVIDIVPADDTSSSNIRIPTPTTMESLFRYFLDICGPVSRELVRGIAELTSDGDFKHRLEALTRDRDAFYEEVTLKKLTLTAVLQAATTVRDENGSAINVAVSYVLENLKKLQPRSYSISSSAAVDPRIAAITALAVSGPPRPPRETSSCPSHRFRGLASNYLLQLQKEYNRSYSKSQQPTNYYYSTAGPRGLLEGGKVFAYIRRSNFKLPPDPSTPIIMIGSGTGVSPFRAFVQERMKLKNQGCEVGKTVLLVGHRAPDQDYYYQDLWQEASKALGKRFVGDQVRPGSRHIGC
ncbi:hypothetical protein CBS147332_6772 [Penicillium roqueforti]|nr:hypothetical protein CBS147332_6772 [Penicillium roqueforti]KAI3112146.1 hypothetical protein CBS147331_4700 [Penicillium roqueforti]